MNVFPKEVVVGLEMFPYLVLGTKEQLLWTRIHAFWKDNKNISEEMTI
jgi:hypothetical protein